MKYLKYSVYLTILLLFTLTACSSLPGKKTVEQNTESRNVALQLMDQGNSQFDKALYETALQNYQAALYLYSGIDFQKGAILSILSIARSQQALARSEKAQASMNLALEWAEQSGDTEQIRNVRNHLADFYIKTGELQSALEECMKETGLDPTIQNELNSERLRLLGTIRKKENDYAAALDFYLQATQMDQEINSLSDLALDFYLTASIYSLQESYPEAIEALMKALDKDRYIEYVPGVASDLSALAVVYFKSGDKERALYYYRKAYLAWKGLNRTIEMEEIQKKIEQITGEEFFSP